MMLLFNLIRKLLSQSVSDHHLRCGVGVLILNSKVGKTFSMDHYNYLYKKPLPMSVRHGHQSSSFIAKCNDNKFICGTSHYAAAELETCKGLHVI